MAAPLAAQEVSEPAARQEKKVCRTQKITGSLTRRIRTCMTQAQWDRLAEGTRRGVDEFVRDGDLANSRMCRDYVGHCDPRNGSTTSDFP